MNLRYLLLPREKRCIRILSDHYRKVKKSPPEKDENLVMFLGDSAENRKTWSGTSGKVPTLRRNCGLMWLPAKRRWMTGKEKLASLAFPINQEAARSMGVIPIPVKDTRRASRIAGNALNFSSITVVQLVALCCHVKFC